MALTQNIDEVGFKNRSFPITPTIDPMEPFPFNLRMNI